MKITSIQAIELKPISLSTKMVTSNILLDNLYYVIARIETDAGITGYGEALPAWEIIGETPASVMGCIALYQDKTKLFPDDLLLDRPIDTLEKIAAISAAMSPTDSPAAIVGNPAAKAAIEQAMLDCLARYQETSFADTVGITPKPVPGSMTCGVRSVEDTLAWVEAALEQDPQMIRLKLNNAAPDSFERNVAVVNEARNLIRKSGKHTKLSGDANQSFFDAERAIAYCRRIQGALDWLEQPASSSDPAAFARIRSKVDVPLMANESLHDFGNARMLAEMGGVDYFNVKMMKAGGLFPTLKIQELAGEHDIGCHIGSMIETSLGSLTGYLAASAHIDNIISTDMSAFTLIPEDPWGLLKLEDGFVHLTSDVLIGTGLDDDRLAEYAA